MTDVKEKILLGGVKQRIHYVTDDPAKPVLLFLHGGPGVCNRHDIMTKHRDLLDTFTIVTWDQRGTGGSYYNIPEETLTVDRVTEDAAELVDWLCRKFNKDKIFVIGGSWGSELGVWLITKHPEKVAALFGFGQVVDNIRNEEISYDFTMKCAVDENDQEAIKKLESVGPPEMGQYKGGFDGMMVQRRLLMKYGGYSRQPGKESYWNAMIVPMLKSREYSFTDLIGLFLGYKRVLIKMWPDLCTTRFPETCTKFDTRFYIFDGRLDMNTPSELVEEWYDMIEAPDKDLIWFENSGHNPMGDEPEKFKKLLREKALKVVAEETCRI
ncbi:MAG: alpha/beta hydrolase [Oscillospiraceae bacterium]|nr:alpha/beta hydrolase [Oscillospiraceae bacterium]